MKKIIILVVSVLITTTIVACGNDANEKTQQTAVSQTESTKQETQLSQTETTKQETQPSQTETTEQETQPSQTETTKQETKPSQTETTEQETQPSQTETTKQETKPSQIETTKQETKTETTKQETKTETTKQETTEVNTIMRMNVTVGGNSFAVELEDNDATRELVSMMQSEPITISMSDYSGFEKVGALGRNLPTSNAQTTTQPGDIVLYNGNNIVMFYGSNSWSYTRIGRVENLSGWAEALGSGDITAIFTLP